MSSKDRLKMLKEKFTNDKTGEEVEGITIIIDGKVKEVFDAIMITQTKYKDYTEILRDAVYIGVEQIIKSEIIK